MGKGEPGALQKIQTAGWRSVGFRTNQIKTRRGSIMLKVGISPGALAALATLQTRQRPPAFVPLLSMPLRNGQMAINHSYET